ncbi:hypothetical protein PV327_004682 [Microctonus hyperodae]|uniref:[histone H4]-lysine(20) N-methyltransferase n=1 Tax=Microctonus hyperodae TaxID=165561 RepID=A0AA39KMS4_MICHY|nr:hypothetical protein PV327_004682 [Microctonus hyperodae]
MVKGRRKRAPAPTAINTRSSKLSEQINGTTVSPLKKEIKLEKDANKKDNAKINSTPGHKTTLKKSVKSSECITSYFSPQIHVHSENKLSRSVQINTSNSFVTDNVLFQSDCNIKIKHEEIDASPVEEIFETDETPVAVPHHDPSTPHRINMPNVQNDDSDTRSSTDEADKKPFKNCQNGVKLIEKKIPSRGRGKLKFTSSAENNIANLNHKVTEYFPVRRSIRKCKKTVLEEKQRDLENKVLCEVEDGLEVKHFVGKGRGVVTTREFKKGEFVVEYAGDLIDQIEAKKREAEYAKDQNTGCYMYYFQHRNHQYCVDATAETNKLGRLVNHCRNGNLVARVVEIGNTPHLVLTAKEDIPIGIELNYDYGDRSRESIRNHPWLAL